MITGTNCNGSVWLINISLPQVYLFNPSADLYWFAKNSFLCLHQQLIVTPVEDEKSFNHQNSKRPSYKIHNNCKNVEYLQETRGRNKMNGASCSNTHWSILTSTRLSLCNTVILREHINKREGFKKNIKVILITFGSEPPPPS